MSQSLLDLIKAYGDARADWVVDKSTNRVPEALAAVEAALYEIREAIGWNDTDKATVYDILDGSE